MSANFKPLSLEDFKLSPKELETIVEGAQKFLPPEIESPAESQKDESNADS